MNAADVQHLFERELSGINVTVQTKQQDDHLHILVAGQDALAYYLKSFTQQVVSAIADDGSPWETLTVWTRGREATQSVMAVHVNFPEVGIEVVSPEPELPIVTAKVEPELAEANDPVNIDLSQYCFTRNTMLLDHALAQPPAAVAAIVQLLHELDLASKAKLLPAIASFLENPQRFDIEPFPPHIQEWFKSVQNLDARQRKSLEIWLSRYCRNPENTIAEIQPSLT
ncbi:MAG: hypothetical protein AAF704_16945 [Cyanobacteria bacterium P01_D01_bin.123]